MIEDLRRQNEELTKKSKEDVVSARKNYSLIIKLEAEVQELKKKKPEITPELRQQIIEDYRRSAELKDAILEEYGKGFFAAKAKVIKAGVDPSQIFSDSEDEADP